MCVSVSVYVCHKQMCLQKSVCKSVCVCISFMGMQCFSFKSAQRSAPVCVQIMRIAERSVSGVTHVEVQGGDAPLRVFSGPLLGITTKKQLPE